MVVKDSKMGLLNNIVLIGTLICLVSGQQDVWFGDYNCANGRDVFVHLFEWKHSDVAAECENFLADAGYCAVQLSPANEHRIIDGDHPDGAHVVFPWWQRYQPVSYQMGSRSGSEEEFRDMVERCNAVGVRVYADIILNHMTQPQSGIGSDGSFWDGDNQDYPNVPYTSDDFHGSDVCDSSDGTIQDYSDADEVRYCALNGLNDLEHSKEYVRSTLAAYLNKLIGWGVAGFRIDAAKHMFPNDVAAILSRLDNLNSTFFDEDTKPFVFMEVIDLGGEPITVDDYSGYGRITEFKYGMNLGDCIRGNSGQRMSYLRNFGEGWDFMAGLSAVTFVDNHDNQRGHGAGGFSRILTFFESRMYKIANAFELAWPYGYVRLMSSYDWPRTIVDGKDVNDWMGPPSDSDGNTDDVVCFGNWTCEHRWPQISNMVGFHNAVVGTDVVNWWDNDNQAIAFSRGSSGFIFFNNEDYEIERSFNTGLPDGEYCDVISCDNPTPPCGNSGGNCRPAVTVSGGYATIKISPRDEDPIVALYVE